MERDTYNLPSIVNSGYFFFDPSDVNGDSDGDGDDDDEEEDEAVAMCLHSPTRCRFDGDKKKF